jgi:hypothetical protein
MRSNFTPALLVGALLCLSLCALGLSVRHYFSLKELERLQGQYLRMSTTMKAVQSLAAQCVQYSKINPDINPILEQFVKPATNIALPSSQPAP